MKDSDARTNVAPQSTRSNQRPPISARKLKANRENAKKSTGPKTVRGKAFSRRNAVKHGLFVNSVTDFEALYEDPKQYQELLNGLWDQYQPVGRAEEMEVERIALSCWRLKRAWRYENAENLAARRDFVRAELDYQEEYCKQKDKEEEAIIVELESAKKEIEETRQLSQERKQRIIVMMPGLQELWLALDERAQKLMEHPSAANMMRKTNPEWRIWASDIYTVTQLIAYLKDLGQRRYLNVREAAVGRHAIPNPEVLDRILRYETTIERYLNRAMERLDRLQRHRRGEAVSPPLSVHLS